MKRFGSARELGTLAMLLIVLVLAGIKEPRFLSSSSIDSILLWMPLLLVVGVGQMMVIITRGIDVSIGSMLGFAGIAVGMVFRSQPHLNVFVGLALGLCIGLILGSINGLLVAWAKVPPIIATLGSLSAYRGLVFILSHGEQVDSNTIPEALTAWSQKGPLTVGGVTVSWLLIMALAIAALAGWVMLYSRLGRDIYALGSNPEAARLRGIPVGRTTFAVYAITGALAGAAGVMYASRYGFVNPATAGLGFEMTVIAAVAIGGTKVTGGSGTVLGVVLGCLLLGAINVALAVLGIAGSYQTLVYGVVILVAVLVDSGLRGVMDRLQGVR